MKKSRFTEEQIVRILTEVEAGAKVAETCRRQYKRQLNDLQEAYDDAMLALRAGTEFSTE